jgi:hypothetical protein
MPTLTLTVQNALREPLPDRYDLEVKGVRTLQSFVRRTNLDGAVPVTIRNLPSSEPLIVQVFPVRHRPVGAPAPFLTNDAELTLNAPLHPDRASVGMPEWKDLDATLKRVLTRSVVEGADAQTKGKKLYDALDDLLKAGLLNLFTKMSNTGLAAGLTAWDFVTDLYRIRPDRIFANVEINFRDAVKTAERAEIFKEAPDNQHTPPDGYERAGSFKSRDRTGNLQLTFFSKIGALEFKVDADIDDANGLGHALQVLDHWITDSETHPYDIHQILSFDQRLALPYTLTPWA